MTPINRHLQVYEQRDSSCLATMYTFALIINNLKFIDFLIFVLPEELFHYPRTGISSGIHSVLGSIVFFLIPLLLDTAISDRVDIFLISNKLSKTETSHTI